MQPFVIEEDIWIDHKTGKPVAEEQAINGAFRLNVGERISNEEAEKYGLKKAKKTEKAETPEEPEVEEAATEVEDKAVTGPKRKTARKR